MIRTSVYIVLSCLQVYAFSDDDQDLQGTLVQGLLHEESTQEHHENLPVMECQDLPVICYKGRAPQKSRKIPHSSSRLRSMRKTGSDKASRIAQTEKMVETYLQKRRHNKKMIPCKFNVGMIVEALEEDGFWYKAKVVLVQKEKMKIHWTGYNYDEWLSASKIRLEVSRIQRYSINTISYNSFHTEYNMLASFCVVKFGLLAIPKLSRPALA
ncbi:uncharacterized protein [Haliotis cracherodii]|uniref:uncharacterized protein n=1 Tax=Haliotis cracherodii TaxID=6455 RepID=UPI0039EB03EE